MKKAKPPPPLLAGIHTLEILSRDYSPIELDGKPYLSRDIRILPAKKNQTRDYTLYSYALNPNKTRGQPVLREYSEFQAAFSDVMQDMEIEGYERKSRVDFCFDSLDDNYERYNKFNRCLVLLISLEHRVKNRFESFDPLTLENKSICIMGSHMAVENYNKGIEEDPSCGIKNRLELRCTSLAYDREFPDIFTVWERILKRSLAYFEALQSKTNQGLFERWNQDRNLHKTENDFIRHYRGFIYTKRQLIELYELLGKENAAQAAKNFIQRNKIELLHLNDLSDYVNSILESANNFFAA